MATLHWALRSRLRDLRDEGRLAVLTALILHANMRNRCWVSTDLLMAETGWSRSPVVAAKKWLQARGAFVLVPYKKRVDEELDLPRRQHVFQLTGIMDFDGEKVPYLFMSPEAQAAVEAVIIRLKSSVGKSSPSESSVGKSSPSEPKGSSLSKGGSIFEGGTTSQDAAAVFKAYENNIGLLTPMLSDLLKDALNTYPAEWIVDAFAEAVRQNKRSWAYAEGILKRWAREGRGAGAPPTAAQKPEASPFNELDEDES